MGKNFSVITGCLLAALLAGVAQAGELPQECRQECSTPYGEILGKSPSGVEAYSNCNSSCVVFEPANHQGTYTGIKWQCVEYARRWLLVNLGVVYGDVDVAADIWTRITGFKGIARAADLGAHKYQNGSAEAPRRGDLLIYGREYLGTGHVAVVVEADTGKGLVRVGEQNYRNNPWAGPWAREIPLIRHGDGWWLLDPYLLGWVRAEQDGGIK